MKTKTKKPSHEETAIAMVVTCIVAGHVVKAWGPDGDFTVGPYHKAVGEPTFALFGYGRRIPEPYQAREGSAQDMARMFVASCVGSTRAREAARKIEIPFFLVSGRRRFASEVTASDVLSQAVLQGVPLMDALLAPRERALTPIRCLQLGLERIGWTIENAEIDLVNETARIELRRGDLHVTFDARNGRASSTRERVYTETQLVGRRGDRFRAEVLRTRFVGRTRHEGARSGLRWLCGYIADNAVRPILDKDVQALVRLVLDGQRHLLTP